MLLLSMSKQQFSKAYNSAQEGQTFRGMAKDTSYNPLKLPFQIPSPCSKAKKRSQTFF